MRKEVLASIIAILVVASLGIGYLAGGGTQRVETSTLTSTTTTTSTSIETTTSPIVPVLSQNASIAITSTNLIVATPDACIIYNATVLDNSTEPVDNIAMVFQNYTYHSHITNQNTLYPGQSTSFNFCYYSNAVTTEPPPFHVVLIYGTFENNQPFAFVERIELAWTNGAPI